MLWLPKSFAASVNSPGFSKMAVFTETFSTPSSRTDPICSTVESPPP